MECLSILKSDISGFKPRFLPLLNENNDLHLSHGAFLRNKLDNAFRSCFK